MLFANAIETDLLVLSGLVNEKLCISKKVGKCLFADDAEESLQSS